MKIMHKMEKLTRTGMLNTNQKEEEEE